MFRTKIKNLESSESYPIEFFEDDTIEIVRQQISKSVNIHPDRLFIVIKCELSANYYKQDKRNWDTLFYRLSLNGQPIEKDMFSAYLNNYREPQLNIEFGDYDRDFWMTYPPELKDLWDPPSDFTEYFIFGVEDLKSYCLPFNINPQLVSKILASQQPIPENSKLFNSFYSLKDFSKIEFGYIPFKEIQSNIYFPLLKTITPIKLTNSEISLLDTNAMHLKDLLGLEVPIPKETHILKATWFVELVDTEIEEHIRTRFEQMFYGLTLTPKIPCISFYTGSTEVSRHKFYTEDPKTKKTFLDLPMWSAWWTKSKPSRPRPTLVLYRGKSREHFDRISISATDITFAVYRSENEKYNLDDLRNKLYDWFMSFDSIQPFIEKSDLIKCRWTLQDIKFEAKYSESLEELDTKRLKCLSTIFKEDEKQKTIFKFLRTDYALEDLTSIELHILDLLKDNNFLRPQDIQEELKISLNDANKLLQSIKLRLETNPELLNRKQRGFPILQFLPNSVIVANITHLQNTLKYTNLLRYILSNPSSKNLDKICPKKVENVESKISVTNTEFDLDNEFGDLFGYLENTESKEEKEEESVKEEKETKTKTTKKGTVYNYFINRLEAFDPNTFKLPKGFNYPKECEQGRQPIILSESELGNILKDYDPRLLPDNKKIELDEPNGIMSCPEYWCMYDKIPLEKSQLIEINGKLCCPECNGKLQDSKLGKSQDTKEYSVIKRKKGQSYPGYTKYENLTKDQERELPCCFGTPRTEKKSLKKDDSENKYYVLGETKTSLDPLKFSLVSLDILKSLFIPENYELIIKSGNRIPAGLSGYFRVGLGRVSQTLPFLFKVKEQIPYPYENPKLVLNCSFLATWSIESDEHLDIIKSKLSLIKPFQEDTLALDKVSRLISGISKAFKDNKLTQLQELEYCALFLHIDIFRILIDTNKFGCTFFTQQVLSKKRGLIILQRGSEIDCLCHIVRTKREFEYRPNVFDSPFTEETLNELNNLKSKACHIKIPNQEESLLVLEKIYKGPNPNTKFILDSFGRTQGVFIENDLILPYKNTPIPYEITEDIIQFVSYSDIKDSLPELTEQRIYLELAKSIHEGYEYQEDILDSQNNIVEILLKSGLRIPVKPEKSQSLGDPQDVINTIMQDSELSLTFGQTNKDHLEIYKNISYNSEIFEFILFELTKDLQLDDYKNLRSKLELPHPTNKDIFSLLEEWFDKTIYFNKISKPIEFLSKIRKPCGQFKSNKLMCEESNMCGWTENTCKIQIRDTISKKKLFNKLLNTLLENSKTRYMILDNRTTPFFSTILYLELPNEVIMTDFEIKKEPI
jgi:hypothetical protein